VAGLWLVFVFTSVLAATVPAGLPVVLLLVVSPVLVQLALVATGSPVTAPRSVDWIVGAALVAPVTRPVARVLAVVRDHVPPGEVVGLFPETPAEGELLRRLGFVPSDADGRWMVFRVPGLEAPPSPPPVAPPSAERSGGMHPQWTGTTMTWTST
jgi:hypothetical protein